MGYCHTCGCWDRLGPAAMCAACLDRWRPATPTPPDLGTRQEVVCDAPHRHRLFTPGASHPMLLLTRQA